MPLLPEMRALATLAGTVPGVPVDPVEGTGAGAGAVAVDAADAALLLLLVVTVEVVSAFFVAAGLEGDAPAPDDGVEAEAEIPVPETPAFANASINLTRSAEDAQRSAKFDRPLLPLADVFFKLISLLELSLLLLSTANEAKSIGGFKGCAPDSCSSALP